MLVIGVRQVHENVDGFSAALWRLWGNFKGGVPPLMGVGRGRSPLLAHANCGSVTPPTRSGRSVPEAFTLPEIVGVAQ